MARLSFGFSKLKEYCLKKEKKKTKQTPTLQKHNLSKFKREKNKVDLISTGKEE